MSMSDAYGPANKAQSLTTIRRARDLGVSFLDTANVYGAGDNERLVGEAIAGHRDQYVIATKFGLSFPDGQRVVNGRPDYVKACCDESLQRLNVDHIDLYYQHRVDPDVPIEDTVGAMAELIVAGKVRFLGLCEATAATLDRASRVHPISALQSEWALWTRDVEAEVLPQARRLGIGLVAYGPLGRGLLTGAVRSRDTLETGDGRQSHPRFQPDTLTVNLQRIAGIQRLAQQKGVTPGQLALAWLLAQGHDVVPIPGTKHPEYVDENAGACDVALSSEDLSLLDELSAPGAWAGERAHPRFVPVYGDSPPQAGS
jgi:aryl-alcohol dehydrogenase-like predicted oxidoreductase